jgi:DNA sulfur modification protein DndD
MFNALEQLKEANITDKSVKNVNADTINQIIERGKCICGSEVCTGNEAYNTLNALRDYIPPKHIGSAINEFRKECNSKALSVVNVYDSFAEKYGETLSFDSELLEIKQEIQDINTKLDDLKDVGKLQSKLNKYSLKLSELNDEVISLNGDKRVKESEKGRMETERSQLTLKDKNNRKINIYTAYTDYMFNYIYDEYAKQEKLIRDELGNAVNNFFKKIYRGGFSLKLNDKYDVQIIADDLGGYTEEIETSTAQSISIIFAFISGVIKIARESEHKENGLIESEAYPLVMDAPLSAFDKERIKTVCEILPTVSEQVIIFIKDTDGDLAEEHLSAKIGHKAEFYKINEFETIIQ